MKDPLDLFVLLVVVVFAAVLFELEVLLVVFAVVVFVVLLVIFVEATGVVKFVICVTLVN
jgi:hypothetical protein